MKRILAFALLFFCGSAFALGLGTPTGPENQNPAMLELRVTTPATIDANQDDYTIGNYTHFRLASDAARNITGIASTKKGRAIWLTNVGAQNIILAHQSISSTAAYRIITTDAASCTIRPGCTANLIYDGTTARWRVVALSSGSVPLSGTVTTNTIPKGSGVGTLGDSSITDDGTNVTVYGRQVRVGAAPVTADADADVLIQSTAAGQVPLVVQGAAGQTDNLQEWQLAGGYTTRVNAAGDIVTAAGTFVMQGLSVPFALRLWNGGVIQWSSTADASSAPFDLSLSRKAAKVLGIGDGGTSDAIRIGASGRVYGNAVANPTAHATASNHTSNGTLITITTTAAHNLVAGQSVTLAGWGDIGGNNWDKINGTYLVNTTPLTTTITLNPATYGMTTPTNATNPTTVGTITVNDLFQAGVAPVSPKTGNKVSIGGPVQIEGTISQNGSYGGSLNSMMLTEELTCATGATTFTSSAHLLPANSYITGVATRVTQVCTAATTFQVGIGGATAKFAEALQPNTLGQMTSSWGLGHAAGTGGPAAMLLPFVQPTDDHVVITTADDPGVASLKVRITVWYKTITPPTW
jgi:hypothetical protein